MSILTNRIIFDDNGSLSDHSIRLNDIAQGTETWAYVAGEDYVYLGSEFPFNQRFIRVDTANTAASSVSVDLWDGQEWKAAVNVIDQTSDGTASLAQSGIISFTLNKSNSWDADDTDKMTGSGLESLVIYDLYWARLSFSADLDVGTAVQYLGYKFNNDQDLSLLYPELNTSNSKEQFESGKTSWEDQELEAANMIVKDLQLRGVILSANQILDASSFKFASIYKLTEMIFTEFGQDYESNRELSRQNYIDRINGNLLNLDKNGNTRLDAKEQTFDLKLERR